MKGCRDKVKEVNSGTGCFWRRVGGLGGGYGSPVQRLTLSLQFDGLTSRAETERMQPPPPSRPPPIISGPTVWFLIKVLQSCVAVVGVTDELMFRSFSLSLLESTPLTHCCTFTTYFWRNLLCPLLHRTGAEINPYNQTGVLFYIWPCILFIPVWTQTQTQTHSKLQTLHLKSTPRRGISSITNHTTVVS